MPLNPWMIALVTGIAATLLRSGFRRHGWARLIYIVLAIAVLLLALWWAVRQAGERAESQLSNSVGKMWQGDSPSPGSGPVR